MLLRRHVHTHALSKPRIRLGQVLHQTLR